MKIYLASSWRNKEFDRVLGLLRANMHEVYDFKNEPTGFSWDLIDKDWGRWTAQRFREALKHPLAKAGFESDMNALAAAEACVLLLPCGASAHLEAGWAAGAGKRVVVVTDSMERSELMYLMAHAIALSDAELLQALR